MKKFFFLTLFVIHFCTFNAWAGSLSEFVGKIGDFLGGNKKLSEVIQAQAETQKQTNEILVRQIGTQKETSGVLQKELENIGTAYKDQVEAQKETNEILVRQIGAQKETSNVLQKGLKNINTNCKDQVEAQKQTVAAHMETNRVLKNIDTTYKGIMIVGGSVAIIKSGIEFYHWMRPSKEEIAKKINDRKQAEHNYRSLCAEEAMNECLVRNAHAQKGPDGMPCKCEDVLNEYAQVVGLMALDDVKKAFGHYVNE